jgi:hypothetical protein
MIRTEPTIAKMSNTASLDMAVLPDIERERLHLSLAEEIISTERVQRDGLREIFLPAGTGEIEAMQALNVYFRAFVPDLHRGAIPEYDLNKYSQYNSALIQDSDRGIHIKIYPIVEESIAKKRNLQAQILRELNLRLAKPAQVALILAVFACKNKGESLIGNYQVRTTAPDSVISANKYSGICHLHRRDNFININIGVAASASHE